MKYAYIGLFLLLTTAITASAQSPYPIRVFIVMEHAGFVDDTTDTAKDLAKGFLKATDKHAAKELAVLVDTVVAADVTIEILSRRTENVNRQWHRYITVRVTAGNSYTTEISVDTMTAITWSAGAWELREKLNKFLRANGPRLVANRVAQ